MPCQYFHSVDRSFAPSLTPNTDAAKVGGTKKRAAQVQAQARPKVRLLVSEVDRVRRAATGPWRSNALQRGNKCRATKAKNTAGWARPKKTGWLRTGSARLMPWNCPHESHPHDRHGDGQHPGSEAIRAALALHAPQAHQSLQRPATASPCKGLKKECLIFSPYT